MHVQLGGIQHVCQDNACNHAHPICAVYKQYEHMQLRSMEHVLRSIQHVRQETACKYVRCKKQRGP